MKPLTAILTLCCLAWAPIALAGPPGGSAYLEGDQPAGVVLCHGRGKYPTWKVVNPLRKGVHDELGYHTLSIQMPAYDKNWKRYVEDFPEAFSRIQDAVRFLKEEAGVSEVFLLGHSMGSRMASAYVSGNPDHGLSGLVVAGCRNNGPGPLDCHANLSGVTIPVLDVWGARNGKDSRAAAEREGLKSERYQQVAINGANHKFDGYDDELVSAVTAWLKGR